MGYTVVMMRYWSVDNFIFVMRYWDMSSMRLNMDVMVWHVSGTMMVDMVVVICVMRIWLRR